MEPTGLEGLTGIVAFARVASLGSFSAAARALAISPSAVSKSIRRLEQRLEVSLFARTTRSLTLTPIGQDLLVQALRLLKDAEEIEQTILATRWEPAGVLKITAPVSIGVHLLSPILPGFRKLYPRVRIDLCLSDRLSDIVEEGLDIAIRIADLRDSRLLCRTLAPNDLCLYASPAYLEQRSKPNHPDDLSLHDCVNIRFHSSGLLLKWKFQIGSSTCEVTPDPVVVLDSIDAMTAVLKAGGGVGMLPGFVAAPLVACDELVPVLTDFCVRRSPISVIWPESRKTNPNVRAFLDYLYHAFPGDLG